MCGCGNPPGGVFLTPLGEFTSLQQVERYVADEYPPDYATIAECVRKGMS